MTLKMIADIGIWAGTVIPILFVIQYTLIARWWRSPNGILIVALDLSIFGWRAPVAWHLVNPTAHIDYWWPVLMLAAGPLVIVWRMIFFEVQRRRANRRRQAQIDQVLEERTRALFRALAHQAYGDLDQNSDPNGVA
jgi:hypothetical protein